VRVNISLMGPIRNIDPATTTVPPLRHARVTA
jgi:hypothetical protein